MKVYFYTDEDGYEKELFKIIQFDGEFWCSNPEAYKEVEIKMFKDSIHHACYGGQSITCVEIETQSRHHGALVDLFGMEIIRVKESAYRVERCYGGPEEGGWWYDGWEYLGEAKDIPEDNDNGRPLGYSNSEGHVRHVEELFIGDHETKSTPYYS